MFNVILPTYNEAGSILVMIAMLDDVFKQLRAKYTIIVVDDNSPDNTSGIVKGLNNENVKVIDRPGKLGLGSAYVTGLSHCIYEYTVILDSDLQHDPFTILDMYKLTEKGADIVSGTRYIGTGKVCGWSFMRKLVSCGANNLARYTLGLNTKDLTGSFRLYRTEVLKELIPTVRCLKFGFQMEIIARAEAKGYKIVECPIVFYDRKAGESKISWKEMVHFVIAIVKLYF
ncbi:dolichol-phosphate mannosyltransferase [Pancytospora epiphaga]|nr:dolichol-phosphate mannosyltransferase [Pancytospora epiphaga]